MGSGPRRNHRLPLVFDYIESLGAKVGLAHSRTAIGRASWH